MKRFVVTLLAVFYLAVSSGATVQFHYCMGKLVDWGFASSTSSETCPTCGMANNTAKDCCKKENKQVKVDVAQKLAPSSIQFQAVCSEINLNDLPVLPEIYTSALSGQHPLSHAPPGLEGTPVFLRYRNIRI